MTTPPMAVTVREGRPEDLEAIQEVHRLAFGAEEGESIVELVLALLKDPTAQPVTSLVAVTAEGKVVGHVLFTRAGLTPAPEKDVGVSILAPLGVVPDFQSQGIGGRLIREGFEVLRAQGTSLVFVLGHPGYYPRYGFEPAGALGFEAAYPIEENNADAWMVQALSEELPAARGKVVCAAMLDKPELWQEPASVREGAC
mmetsp:Transcript_37370/g.69749  ORF Transcript_37370/g.69749 Transcript_37370/m.69749 type:complete len:199 (-) Transcript_37370:164-760(-)